MGNPKQQVISRFFAAKPKNPPLTDPSSSPSSSSHVIPNPQTPTPKISATVSFSPSKRRLSSKFASISPKPSKIAKPSQPDPSLHQKFIQKLLEPVSTSPEPSVKLPPPSNLKKYTPLEQQVVELKEKYPDVILMVEVGYKYRFFGEDAAIAAQVLGIYAHVDHNFMTASVPTFRLNVHVRRLVSAGYKVGVVKQIETAAIKAHGSNRLGPFSRGLSALYTKATIEVAEMGREEERCGSDTNYLVCVVEEDGFVENPISAVESGFDVRIAIVAVEISTGDVVHGEFNDDIMRSGLETVLLSMNPAELLLGEPVSQQTEKLLLAYAGPASNARVERTSRVCFNLDGALAEILSLYDKMGEDRLADHNTKNIEAEQENPSLAIEGVMSMPDLAIQALALTFRHLKQFGLERILGVGTSFRPFSSNAEMTLSVNALKQLEVLKNHFDGSESGSLLHTMNHTLTLCGSRLLRHWVSHPLCDRGMITARLDAVSEIAESMGSYRSPCVIGGLDGEDSDVTIGQPELSCLLSSVLTALGRSPDIQRGITRIFHRTATAPEFIAVIQAILYAGKQLQKLDIEEKNHKKVQVNTVSSVLLRRLILTASSSSVIGNGAKLLSSLNKEAADRGDTSNLIIPNGQFLEVARAREDVQSAKDELELLIVSYRKHLGIHDLEFVNVSGSTHLIELSLDVKVPLNWMKVNSTKKTVRYHPPEVVTALDRLSLANEELDVVCQAAWDSFLRGFGKYYREFQAAVQALAAIDCLHSLALLSRNNNYVRPVFVDDDKPVQLHICSGRHPVLASMLQDNFVPNDTNLHVEKEYCQIITGPNMGGKSCYIRQVALMAIMAQVGSFVPASSAKLHVLDGIYTRMGASDSIQQGRSTFLEELSETSHILHKCTARSLVIIDELGRGTSTHDGVAIAYATLHYLLEQKRCMVLFVTHYPKIAEIRTEFPGSVMAYHVSYLTSDKDTDMINPKSNGKDVTYLYKLVPGLSERSFGVKVAKLAQLPSSCIGRANVMATRLESVVSRRVGKIMGKVQLLKDLIGEDQEAQESMSEPAGCSDAKVECFEALAYSYNEFFSYLKSILRHDDLADSFQRLKDARRFAKELICSKRCH